MIIPFGNFVKNEIIILMYSKIDHYTRKVASLATLG